MRRVISVLSLAVLCLLCTACGWTKPVPLPEEDAVSEAPALTRDLPVAEALQRGAVQSILVIGDSISDGNTDDGCVWGQEDRTAIAHEPEGTAQPEDFASVTCLGCNRADLSGDTAPGDVNGAGEALYPLGASWYYTWNTFTPALPYGAFLETHREADGSAVQYARTDKYQPTEFSLVRRWENGGWTDWADND